jgi:hypothetical protein
MFQTLIDPAFLAFENGGTPVLDLNFAATKALDSRITFTRASVGTFVDSTGTLQTASSGAARFTHNPVTLRSLGLMIEESRTNLLLNSATLSTQNVTTTAAAHTLHFTGTGTITLTGTSTAGPLVGTGTGEGNRVSLTFTPTAGTLTLTVSGTVTNAQLEVGVFKTSYIPTTGATVQRAADVCEITGTNFSQWYRQDQGTFVAEGIPARGGSASAEAILGVNDSGSSNRLTINAARAGANSLGSALSVDPSGSIVSPFTYTRGALDRYAASYASGLVIFAINAQSCGSLEASVASGLDRILIGNDSGGRPLNGSIARVRYYNRALANALQALTA